MYRAVVWGWKKPAIEWILHGRSNYQKKKFKALVKRLLWRPVYSAAYHRHLDPDNWDEWLDFTPAVNEKYTIRCRPYTIEAMVTSWEYHDFTDGSVCVYIKILTARFGPPELFGSESETDIESETGLRT